MDGRYDDVTYYDWCDSQIVNRAFSLYGKPRTTLGGLEPEFII